VNGRGTEDLAGSKRTGVPENKEDVAVTNVTRRMNREAHPSNGGINQQFHEMTPAIGISSRKEK
jgi:hypothetical protein